MWLKYQDRWWALYDKVEFKAGQVPKIGMESLDVYAIPVTMN